MNFLESIQRAIREDNLDGWLFCNFAHRDRLTDELLGLDRNAVSSRPWFYLLAADDSSVKIVHPIESDILDSLPGTKIVYTGRTGLESALRRLAPKRVAVLSDPVLQVISTMDASSYRLLEASGFSLMSAAPLLQASKGVFRGEDFATHERAAAILYQIVDEAWALVREAFRDGRELTEGEIQDAMCAALSKNGLVTDHPPIVAAGPNSGNPHYSVPDTPPLLPRGRILRQGDVVQLDIWARFPDSVYADISWIGFCGSSVPPDIERRFRAVIEARDLVKPAIELAFQKGQPVSGASLDALVRNFLIPRVGLTALRHRTGHGIDTDCHGSGVNLDSVEFPDYRILIEGSCVSVEPGAYFPDSGFRTEINLYIHEGKPVLSGNQIQTRLLTLEEKK